MPAVQLGVPAADALLRIRAHSFANDQTVAESLVAGTITVDAITAKRLPSPEQRRS